MTMITERVKKILCHWSLLTGRSFSAPQSRVWEINCRWVGRVRPPPLLVGTVASHHGQTHDDAMGNHRDATVLGDRRGSFAVGWRRRVRPLAVADDERDQRYVYVADGCARGHIAADPSLAQPDRTVHTNRGCRQTWQPRGRCRCKRWCLWPSLVRAVPESCVADAGRCRLRVPQVRRTKEIRRRR